MKTLKATVICSLLFLFVAPVISQWQELNTGVTKKMNYCRLVSGNITWVCGDSGTVLRSTNDGTSWLNLTGNGIPSNVNLVSIGGLNDNALIVGGNTGTSAVIYMTSNQGASWFLTFTQPGGTLRSLSYKMYIGDPVGGRWSIWKSSNYGITWDSTGWYLTQNASEHSWNNSYYTDVDDYSFSFGTNNNRIYNRNNTSWSTVNIPFEQNIYSVFWDSRMMGYIGGASLWVTTNSGASWENSGLPGTGNIVSITAQPGFYTTWVVRADNHIYTKLYVGNWEDSYPSPSGSFTNIRLGVAYTDLYALRSNGGISYKRIPQTPLNINQINTEIPKTFELSQNYPNPFNPVTRIKFSIPHVEVAFMRPVQLMVYDALGKEVAVLVNQQLQPGTYEADWDASAYPSGVYYYRLQSGSFTETKKMLMIK